MTLNSIQAAKLESKGEGKFEVCGNKVCFTSKDGKVYIWWFKNPAHARESLRIFRASIGIIGEQIK